MLNKVQRKKNPKNNPLIISCKTSFNSVRKMSGQLVKTVIITALGWLEKRNEEEATFLQGDKLWDSFMNNPLL